MHVDFLQKFLHFDISQELCLNIGITFTEIDIILASGVVMHVDFFRFFLHFDIRKGLCG